jgi:Trypsin-co-occurring domain 2
MADGVGIPLASAIEALRGELLKAVEAGEGQEIQFALGPVELELQVAAENKGGGKTGIKFWLVSLGGEASRTVGRTHTVHLTLTPVRRSAGAGAGDDVLVASDLEARG